MIRQKIDKKRIKRWWMELQGLNYICMDLSDNWPLINTMVGNHPSQKVKPLGRIIKMDIAL